MLITDKWSLSIFARVNRCVEVLADTTIGVSDRDKQTDIQTDR